MIDVSKVKDVCGAVVGCDIGVTLSVNDNAGLNTFDFSWFDVGDEFRCSIDLTDNLIKYSNIDVYEALAIQLERRVSNEQSI